MDDLQSVILAELRALRDDLNEHITTATQRLTKLETQMYAVVGNGKPGRLGVVEESIEKLMQWRWWIVGAGAGISTVVSVIAWFFK